MARVKRPLIESAQPTRVLNCKACLAFMGYSNHAGIAFCSEVCYKTRDWAQHGDYLSDMITVLRDRVGLRFVEIAEALNAAEFTPEPQTSQTVVSTYQNRQKRPLYGRA